MTEEAAAVRIATFARSQFPAIRTTTGPLFDAPAGTQVPSQVVDGIRRHFEETNAYPWSTHPRGARAGELIDRARREMAEFLGAAGPTEIVFGQNATSLLCIAAAAICRDLQPGDEIVLTELEHDANATPWRELAKQHGATVRTIPVVQADLTLDLGEVERAVSARTRVIAINWVSNLTGGITDVTRVAAIGRSVGATVLVDAAQAVPHLGVDVAQLGADFVVAAAHKFFAPHLGVLWGREAQLRSLQPPQVKRSPLPFPRHWETGTPNVEAAAGLLGSLEYLRVLGGEDAQDPRASYRRTMAAIRKHELELSRRLLDGLASLPVVVHGIAASSRVTDRVPIVAFSSDRRSAQSLAGALADAGIAASAGHFDSTELMGRLGRDAVARVGLVHYATPSEVDVFLEVLSAILARS